MIKIKFLNNFMHSKKLKKVKPHNKMITKLPEQAYKLTKNKIYFHTSNTSTLIQTSSFPSVKYRQAIILFGKFS